MVDLTTPTIKRLFEQQVRNLTQRTLHKEDTFDLQLPVTSFLSEMILTEEKTNCTFTGTFLAAEKAQASFDGAVKVL